jgi:hypothetical protein
MKEAATAGAERLSAVIQNMGRSFPRLPNTLNVKTTLANLTLEDLEKRLGPKVAAKLQEGMVSGKTALEMLNTLPAAERKGLLRILVNPSTYGKAGAAGARAMVIPQTPTNNLAPSQQNQNALTQ